MATTSKPKPPKHEALTRAEARALNALETGAGGRDVLLDKLLHIPDVSPDEERLLSFLTDPARQQYGLAALCADAGFTVARFLKFLQRADGAKAMIGAITHVYAAGPDVARDAMELGRIRKFKCVVCDGEGEVLDKTDPKAMVMKKCMVCLGSGEIVKEPTPQQQKIALQLMGMLAQGAGVSLTVNNTASANAEAKTTQQNAFVDHKFMDSLRANTDEAVAHARGLPAGSVAALPESTVVDAEVMVSEGGDATEPVRILRGPEPPREHVPRETATPPRPEPVVVSEPGRVIPPIGIPGGVRRPPPAVT